MTELPLKALASIPGLVVRLGFSTMKLKRRVKTSARQLERSMVRNGMEREVARKLALRYEDTFSIRRLLGKMGHDGIPGFSLASSRR